MSQVTTYFFTGLAVEVSIGIHAKERAAPQRILIDIDYDCLQAALPDDEISSVLDYDAVRKEIEAIATGRHFNLQETLCRAILTMLTSKAEVLRARVSTRKPDIYPNVEAVGVALQTKKS
jgi:dihydroneopterin aldolase